MAAVHVCRAQLSRKFIRFFIELLAACGKFGLELLFAAYAVVTLAPELSDATAFLRDCHFCFLQFPRHPVTFESPAIHAALEGADALAYLLEFALSDRGELAVLRQRRHRGGKQDQHGNSRALHG